MSGVASPATAYDAEVARLRAMSVDEFEDDVYERVLAGIDLDALFRVEQELWTELAMRDPTLEADDDATVSRMCAAARTTVDRMVVRALSDERRYIHWGPPSEEMAADCPCCRMLRDDDLKRS